MVDFGEHTGATVITLDNEMNDTEVDEGIDNVHNDIENFILGSGADTIDTTNGFNAANKIIGNGGGDTIISGPGDDRIAAGLATYDTATGYKVTDYIAYADGRAENKTYTGGVLTKDNGIHKDD